VRALDADLVAALKARLALGAPSDRFGETDALRAAVRAGATAAERRLTLWTFRELLALSRPPVEVAAWSGKVDPDRVRDLARARFGSPARLRRVPKAEDALAAAEQGGAAVLALDPDQPWWAKLLARPRLKATGVLPELAIDGPPAALVIEAVFPEPGGDDRTLWVTDAAVAPAAVEAALSDASLVGDLLLQAGGLKLFQLYGYVQPADARLARAPGRLQGVIGAAPAPFDA
jgi:hypothetical protein